MERRLLIRFEGIPLGGVPLTHLDLYQNGVADFSVEAFPVVPVGRLRIYAGRGPEVGPLMDAIAVQLRTDVNEGGTNVMEDYAH